MTNSNDWNKCQLIITKSNYKQLFDGQLFATFNDFFMCQLFSTFKVDNFLTRQLFATFHTFLSCSGHEDVERIQLAQVVCFIAVSTLPPGQREW